MTQFLEDQGVPCEEDVMNRNAMVFYFPVKAPDKARTREDTTALSNFGLWRTFKDHWTEHNPSITINIEEHEWLPLAKEVYENFDEICGVSFLPSDGGSYKQAPFASISEEKYEKLAAQMPKINWDALKYYELEDTTDNAKELACTGARGCEI